MENSIGLPTIIIVHAKERRSKCTVASLRGDERLQFFRYPRRPINLSGYVRLGMSGPVLSSADANSGLLLLDGTWRWADQMEASVAEVPTRTLPLFRTAYPRVSKVFQDPQEGLATVEALFAALTLLGRNTAGLLKNYPFAEEFLRLNPRLTTAETSSEIP